MNTKIKFTYKDTPYVLEYNRNAIREMERAGFNIEEFRKKPALTIDLAFKGLFLKNHRKTNEKLIEEIYDNFKNKDTLIEKIGDMVSETYESLFSDNKDNDEGNIEWDIVDSNLENK